MARRRTILIGAAALGLMASVAVAVPAQARGVAPHAFGAEADGAAQAQQAQKWTKSKGPVPVVRKLNNPRQLAFSTGGTLLIAEAGKGTVQQIADMFGVPRTTVYGHLKKNRDDGTEIASESLSAN